MKSVDSCQPLTTMRPPLESSAMIRRSRPTASRSAARKLVVDAGRVNAAVPTITWCAPCSTSARARSTVRTPPPTRRRRLRRQHPHQVVVRAAAHGGVEIDHLDLRKGGELAQHLVGAVAFQRLLAALDQLDHLAVHQVDAGNDHAVTRTGMPRLSSSSFSWFTV